MYTYSRLGARVKQDFSHPSARTGVEVARTHNEAICFGLDPAERAALAGLLQRIAARHELTPGVHPGYKDLRVAPK